MARSKYINTFNTTADYDAYIDSAFPEFPNVGYDKQAGDVIIRRTPPNNYQIWGTTTATENFNIKLNNTNVEVTVDSQLGEFYLTGWTGTLTSLQECFYYNTNITSIKKFALDTSQVTNIQSMFSEATNLANINLSGMNASSINNIANMFAYISYLNMIDLRGWDLTTLSNETVQSRKKPFNANGFTLQDVYIDNEATLNIFTNNLAGTAGYCPTSATIHYDNGSQVIDYKWQNNAWTPQS